METDLAKVYSSSVQPRGTVLGSGSSFSAPPVYQRDPALAKLEHSVFSQLANIVQEENKPKPVYKTNGLQVLSVEDAIKELLELEHKSQ